MQLISLVCSSFKDVFKASIAEVRKLRIPNPEDPPRSDANGSKSDLDQVNPIRNSSFSFNLMSKNVYLLV
jgi:hypothetical protein